MQKQCQYLNSYGPKNVLVSGGIPEKFLVAYKRTKNFIIRINKSNKCVYP